jgi:nucleotide-binding universal stress UspA family protein
MGVESILVPLDGSGAAEAVLEKLGGYFASGNGEVRLILMQAVAEYPPHFPFVQQEEVQESLMKTAREYLDGVQKNLGAQPGWRAEAMIRKGDPPEEILRAASDEQVDVIAMSTHGYSGFKRFMLGSVAEKVVRHAERPVFLVRAEG